MSSARHRVLTRLRRIATLAVAASAATGCNFGGDGDDAPPPARCADASTGVTGTATWISSAQGVG